MPGAIPSPRYLPTVIRESFPPAPKFTSEDVPDLTGKVIIVTGANAGMGKQTAKADSFSGYQVLLSRNAKVYMAGRNEAKLSKAIEELKEATGKEGLPLILDLADLKSVKKAVEDFTSKEKELHVLFNNAGVMVPSLDDLTAQGYDSQFGTNVLGHFYLTKLLLPTLLATAKNPISCPEGKVRVVHTSSIASIMADGVNFETLKDGPERRKKGEWGLYHQSKLGNVILSNELARRYGDEGLVSTSVNPGAIKTDLLRHTKWWDKLMIVRPLFMRFMESTDTLFDDRKRCCIQWNTEPSHSCTQGHPKMV
ncbi:short-chain dehydrogenase [Coprinopsis cinerea okayama7|uniref:Short-chain dehydrogenase n=1 Tax=Coprinopsis cinerea (strain Okayama-7 / 130 / ATCC MYA-4618 / FGSC 9003) TaxID=240176 RepID=A8NQY3_COPC7|nr:short-chain dehydrogenase [Coprinopsis cinerea okayama7\|eukprot:XP_001835575.2 short-chain dehydrogenase [Coprinopsis cinerea okayama7\